MQARLPTAPIRSGHASAVMRFGPDINRPRAGLGFAVKTSKDFIGREAPVGRQKRRAEKKDRRPRTLGAGDSPRRLSD